MRLRGHLTYYQIHRNRLPGIPEKACHPRMGTALQSGVIFRCVGDFCGCAEAEGHGAGLLLELLQFIGSSHIKSSVNGLVIVHFL